jgi:hypothetical protein
LVGAIETLLNLRKADPNYQPVLIDGILLRPATSKDKILKNSDLEGGSTT